MLPSRCQNRETWRWSHRTWHFKTGGQTLRSGPEAGKLEKERFMKGSHMKIISSKPWPKPGNLAPKPTSLEIKNLFRDVFNDNDNFQAVGPNLEIWLWSHHAWKWRICERICLCKHCLPSVRKPFYNIFVFRHDGFRARFWNFGQLIGSDNFHKTTPSQIHHFTA